MVNFSCWSENSITHHERQTNRLPMGTLEGYLKICFHAPPKLFLISETIDAPMQSLFIIIMYHIQFISTNSISEKDERPCTEQL